MAGTHADGAVGVTSAEWNGFGRLLDPAIAEQLPPRSAARPTMPLSIAAWTTWRESENATGWLVRVDSKMPR
ncbi:hypothetical protein KXR53_05170 [Inquilinus limosus]|uniref:hypothetical protein n=1 Tax=Inquilinus limosus TaxID=171674 RepID=UPI003F16E79D